MRPPRIGAHTRYANVAYIYFNNTNVDQLIVYGLDADNQEALLVDDEVNGLFAVPFGDEDVWFAKEGMTWAESIKLSANQYVKSGGVYIDEGAVKFRSEPVKNEDGENVYADDQIFRDSSFGSYSGEGLNANYCITQVSPSSYWPATSAKVVVDNKVSDMSNIYYWNN